MKSNRDLTIWKNMLGVKKGEELHFDLVLRAIRTLPVNKNLSQHKPPIIGDESNEGNK